MNKETIIELMKEAEILIDFDAFEPNKSFVEQGVDSLDLSSLFFLIEEKHGVKIPDSDLESLASVDNLVSYLDDKGKY